MILSRSAFGFVEPLLSADSKLSVHAARLVLAEAPGGAGTVWTVSFEVSGKGAAALLFPGAKAIFNAPESPLHRVLERLDYQTAPRFIVIEPFDPCIFGIGAYGRVAPPSQNRPWPHGPRLWTPRWPRRRGPPNTSTTLREAHFSQLDDLGAWLKEKGYDRPQRPLPTRPVLVQELALNGESSWTQPVQFLRPETFAKVDFNRLTELRPPSRRIRFDLYTLASGRGFAPTNRAVVNLPSRIALPEAAFERPIDTETAAIRQRRRNDDRNDLLVRLFASMDQGMDAESLRALGLEPDRRSMVTRHVLFQGPSSAQTLTFGIARAPSAFDVRWYVHRPWRGPLECSIRAAYMQAVDKQQQAAHRLWSTLTGIRSPVLVSISRERGYLLEGPADRAALKPVAVDESAYRE